ncbi:hypothetical protein E2C01_059733 [Portunus trituberculatus]|uniref:Uncharacterized protein n=1 Tax=Portunus trituberculatus TaxID=210409 RepID=A0A5B7H7G3_PORTR|nr:hypothetical protein [Portunus trituberculatus]
MLLVKKELRVESSRCGEGTVEMLEVKLERNLGRCFSIIMTYVPPKTKSWGGEYRKKLESTKASLSLLEFSLINKSKSRRNENHRSNYSKANFGQLRSVFEGVDWELWKQMTLKLVGHLYGNI